jgi:hypothetical protein
MKGDLMIHWFASSLGVPNFQTNPVLGYLGRVRTKNGTRSLVSLSDGKIIFWKAEIERGQKLTTETWLFQHPATVIKVMIEK